LQEEVQQGFVQDCSVAQSRVAQKTSRSGQSSNSK
jgi:hypothetical protein